MARRFHILAALLLAAATASAETYVVKSGDTLGAIASSHGTTVKALMAANGITDPNALSVGRKLTIPAGSTGGGGGSKTYTVVAGDTLGSVAADHGVSVLALANFNRLDDPNRLTPGQTLKIPTPDALPSGGGGRHALQPGVARELDRVRVAKGKWRYIVLHHSATKNGSARSMDLYHRQKRRMENGLAYHFVIGNGNGMRDGEIAIGNRWRRQIRGGHLASDALNEKSIGICLVGDFESRSPTYQQMKSLYALIEYLQNRCGLASSAVKTHRQINTKPTKCPGRHFPEKALRQNI